MATAAAIAGGSILGALSSRSASKRAAKAQQKGVDTATQEQRRQFDITQQNLSPFQEAGVAALGQQQALIGLSGEEAQQQAFAGLAESPGQQFLRDRAQKNLVRNASAIGGLGGGNVRSALVQQGVGFAQQDYGNYYNRLAGISQTGQTTGAQLGQFGAQSATNISNLLGVAGQARASGILGQQQAYSQGIGQLVGLGSMYFGGQSGGRK